MLTVHERSGQSRSNSKPNNDEAARRDEALEEVLLLHVGELESLREEMVAAWNDGRPGDLLNLAEQMFQKVAAFAREQAPFASGAEIKAADSLGVEFQTALKKIRSRNHLEAEEALAQRCILALHEAILAYFAAITRGFSSSRAARSWVELAAIFVVDVKNLTRLWATD